MQSAEKRASSNEDLSTNDHNYSKSKKMLIEVSDYGRILEKAGSLNQGTPKASAGRRGSRSDCSEDSMHNVPLRKKKKNGRAKLHSL